MKESIRAGPPVKHVFRHNAWIVGKDPMVAKIVNQSIKNDQSINCESKIIGDIEQITPLGNYDIYAECTDMYSFGMARTCLRLYVLWTRTRKFTNFNSSSTTAHRQQDMP